MGSKLEQCFKNMKDRNKIGHAFLIGNKSFEEMLEPLNSIISKYILDEEVDINNCPDIIHVKPENNIIKKEQLLDLQFFLQTTSQLFDKKIYIISECEKLNLSAANSLLKIIEEPEKGIYAFLITENINRVIETIKSRCQIFFLSSELEIKDIYKSLNKEYLSVAFSFIKMIESKKEKAILEVNNLINKNIEKKDLKSIINVVEYFYMDCLSIMLNRKVEYCFKEESLIKEIAEKNSITMITKKIMLINSTLNKLESNVNLNLLLDKLIIEFGKV